MSCSSLFERVGLAAVAEICIRAGQIEPRDDRERRWAQEGPRPEGQLETARRAPRTPRRQAGASPAAAIVEDGQTEDEAARPSP